MHVKYFTVPSLIPLHFLRFPHVSVLHDLEKLWCRLDLIYSRCQKQYYWCFYGILHQLLLMSPLAFTIMSAAPKLWHAGKPYTMESAGDTGWDCSHVSRCGRGRWGAADGASYHTALPLPLPCPATTQRTGLIFTWRIPKPKLYSGKENQPVQSDWQSIQNTAGHKRTVQDCDSK